MKGKNILLSNIYLLFFDCFFAFNKKSWLSSIFTYCTKIPCTWPVKWLSWRADSCSKNCFHSSYGASFDSDINSRKLSTSWLKAENRFTNLRPCWPIHRLLLKCLALYAEFRVSASHEIWLNWVWLYYTPLFGICKLRGPTAFIHYKIWGNPGPN